jgi:hypothetical protein
MEDAIILEGWIAFMASKAFQACDVARCPHIQACIKRILEPPRGYWLMLSGLEDDVTAVKSQLEKSLEWL